MMYNLFKPSYSLHFLSFNFHTYYLKSCVQLDNFCAPYAIPKVIFLTFFFAPQNFDLYYDLLHAALSDTFQKMAKFNPDDSPY